MGGGDVLEHALDGPEGRVALPVVPPQPGPVLGPLWLAGSGPAAHGLPALCVGPLQVVGVEVGVGEVQHLQGGHVILKGSKELKV